MSSNDPKEPSRDQAPVDDKAPPPSGVLTGNLRNHFLIAMPGLADPHFDRSLTYICDHNEEGAMGVIVNRPTDLLLSDVFERMNISYQDTSAKTPILAGGPMSKERGFILHPKGMSWQSTVQLSEEVSLTASKDIIDALAEGSGPENPQVALGYAGWGAGQLEAEIKQSSWLAVPAESHILFKLPLDERWQAAANSLGIDMNLVSPDTGNA